MVAKPSASPPIVSVNNVSMRFKQVEALKNISFQVAAGGIFGLVGSDGAGKSTLLRLVATMIKPSQGEIYVDGFNADTERRKVKNVIGYMPQRFGLYQDLTVEENMEFFMDIFNIPRSERKKRKEKYLGFSNLLSFVNRATGNLSGGMKQKLGLACVLVHEPKVLILDEPTNGVDPVSRREFWEILESMKKEGMTVLVSTAYLDEGELCDELALMHRAVIITAASPNKMRGDFENLEEAMIARIQEVDKDIEHDTFRF